MTSETLPKRLRSKASVMVMGERIAWGSDTDLMYEAAVEIDALKAKIAELERIINDSRS